MEIFIFICIVLAFFLALLIWAIFAFIWSSFRNFFHTNYSFFDASFIIAYFLEQLALIILVLKFPNYNSFWIAAFALIVLTTVSFQKLSMESRNKRISETTMEQKGFIDLILKRERKLIEGNKKLKINAENMGEFIRELMVELKKLCKLQKKG